MSILAIAGAGLGAFCFPSQRRITFVAGRDSGYWRQNRWCEQLLLFTRFLLLVVRAILNRFEYFYLLFRGFYQERSRLLYTNLGIMGRLMAG